jgi:2-dehydro-3-deoxyphosphooctonate aldolase (KDO 8-P synthase)
MRSFKIGPLQVGGSRSPFFIAGPCVIESEKHCLKIADGLAAIGLKLGIDLIFKASYDKANRSSLKSYRGPGLDEGLRILEKVRSDTGLPILSDVHETCQVEAAAQVLDVIQIPAFLCRQTDLVFAAASSGRCVNIKKGQFLSAQEMRNVLDKALAAGNQKIMLTERGTFFGYNNLVVDYRSLIVMRNLNQPVVFDVTHSVQSPGGMGEKSGGNAEYIPALARAGAALGVDGFFFEVHDKPEAALSDGPNALRLKLFTALAEDILRINTALRRRP